jgi:TfoX/Sxy family transcriptional regulator of competence genes
MTTRFPIAIVASACALLVPGLHAQSQGSDNFIPNQPQKAGADPLAAESRVVKYTLLLPDEKSSETVKDGERNPFGKSEDELHDIGGKSSNEETKIQEQLSKLHATGLSPGPGGLRVLFGDMWLSKNEVMPPVVKDQTLALRVSEVTRESIQLVWLEKKFTGLPPRMLVIPVDLRATVRRVPHGQLPEKVEAKAESKASKRATAVEIPTPIAANADPAEARKAARLALAPASPPAPEIPRAKDSVVIASAPGRLPRLDNQTPAPPAKNDPTPATSAATEAQIAGPPAPPSNVKTPVLGTETAASAAKTPPAPAANEPAAWKRAMGLMDQLVKLSEAGK